MQNYYSERLGFFLSVGDTVWYLSESGAPIHRALFTAISELCLFQDEPDFVIQYGCQVLQGVGGSTRDTTSTTPVQNQGLATKIHNRVFSYGWNRLDESFSEMYTCPMLR